MDAQFSGVSFTSTFQFFAKFLFNGSQFVVPISKHGVRDQYRVGTRSGQVSRFDRVMNELFFAGKAIFDSLGECSMLAI